MSARVAVSPEGEDLVVTFTAALAATGLGTWASTIGGARAFCARYTSPEWFATRPVTEQIQLPSHLRRFSSVSVA